MRRRGCEDAGQHALERVIRRIVRPQRKDAAGMQMLGQPRKPLRLVQRGVARMQQLSRRVIDVDQHRIEAAARRVADRSLRRNATSQRSRHGPGGSADRRSVACRAAATPARAIRSPRPAHRPRPAIARADFRARPARCSRARARRRRRRDRAARRSAASPSRASSISATVNWLDIRNSSPSLIS